MTLPPSLPNIITVSRILLVPFCVWSILSGQYLLALAAFVIAGLGDALDGFLARRFQLQSELGGYLDPIADKSLLVSIYVALAIFAHIPVWLAILVVTRDILIVGAVVLAWLLERPVAMRPLFISKANTLAQIIYAAALLACLGLQKDWPALINTGAIIVAMLTAGSGGVYMRNWFRHMAAA